MLFSGCNSENPVNAETVSLTEKETMAAETTSAAETVKRLVYEVVQTKPVIALTFDDGPNTTTTAEVLDKLEKYGVPASFFVVGNNINESTAEVVKRAFDMGCEIHNHSKTHSNMTELTAGEIAEEIEFTDGKVFEITGVSTKFFRPPFIAVNNVMQEAVSLPFIAGIGANDWEDSVSADERAERIINQTKDGSIILLHDMQGNSKTVEALDTIIPKLLEDGFQFVTVSELFDTKETDTSNKFIFSNALQTSMY